MVAAVRRITNLAKTEPGSTPIAYKIKVTNTHRFHLDMLTSLTTVHAARIRNNYGHTVPLRSIQITAAERMRKALAKYRISIPTGTAFDLLFEEVQHNNYEDSTSWLLNHLTKTKVAFIGNIITAMVHSQDEKFFRKISHILDKFSRYQPEMSLLIKSTRLNNTKPHLVMRLTGRDSVYPSKIIKTTVAEYPGLGVKTVYIYEKTEDVDDVYDRFTANLVDSVCNISTKKVFAKEPVSLTKVKTSSELK